MVTGTYWDHVLHMRHLTKRTLTLSLLTHTMVLIRATTQVIVDLEIALVTAARTAIRYHAADTFTHFLSRRAKAYKKVYTHIYVYVSKTCISVAACQISALTS